MTSDSFHCPLETRKDFRESLHGGTAPPSAKGPVRVLLVGLSGGGFWLAVHKANVTLSVVDSKLGIPVGVGVELTLSLQV